MMLWLENLRSNRGGTKYLLFGGVLLYAAADAKGTYMKPLNVSLAFQNICDAALHIV